MRGGSAAGDRTGDARREAYVRGVRRQFPIAVREGAVSSSRAAVLGEEVEAWVALALHAGSARRRIGLDARYWAASVAIPASPSGASPMLASNRRR